MVMGMVMGMALTVILPIDPSIDAPTPIDPLMLMAATIDPPMLMAVGVAGVGGAGGGGSRQHAVAQRSRGGRHCSLPLRRWREVPRSKSS